MAINIRKAKILKQCESCKSNGTKLYEIGIGIGSNRKTMICLCNACMHTLLQKMIIVGGAKD